MRKIRVLFVCIHNSARSQMAETLLNTLAGDRFLAESAGLEPGTLNPIAVEAMREVGIDISRNQTKSVFDLLKQKHSYQYLITVCDETSAERCPSFPGNSQKLHWSFKDPSLFTGTYEEKLTKIRELRDAIKVQIKQWLKNQP